MSSGDVGHGRLRQLEPRWRIDMKWFRVAVKTDQFDDMEVELYKAGADTEDEVERHSSSISNTTCTWESSKSKCWREKLVAALVTNSAEPLQGLRAGIMRFSLVLGSLWPKSVSRFSLNKSISKL